MLADIEEQMRQSHPDRRQIDQKLKAAQIEFPHDYRFSYLRGRLAVYGRSEHHEALSDLFHAAEVAITNGDAVKMLEDLMRDGGEGGTLHRIAHGHREWQQLLTALRTGDPGLARQ